MKIKKDSLQTPKGTRDLIGRELLIWKRVTGICEEISSYYGFEEIRTPHFEHSELFSASLGETSDVVEKQMYSFRTRGGDSLVLSKECNPCLSRSCFTRMDRFFGTKLRRKGGIANSGNLTWRFWAKIWP